MVLDVGLVAARGVPPVLEPRPGSIAAVRHGADQRLGDPEHAPRLAGEIEIVVHVGARELAELGRGERPQPAPGAGVDVDFRRFGKRTRPPSGQDQRNRDIAAAVAAGDEFLQRLFHARNDARTGPGTE